MEETESIVTFSERAREEIDHFLNSNQVPADYKVRIGIRGGGCGGMSYIIGFDMKRPEDLEYTFGDLQFLIDKRHSMYILGMHIDFREDEDESGFVFINPQKTVQ